MGNLLEGHVAVVTGGGSGIGEGIAMGYAEQGASVAILDVNVEAGSHVSKTISMKGGNAINVGVDVTDRESCEGAVGEVREKLGVVSILVNNAGILLFDRLTRTSREDFERIMEVNCTGVFLGMQAVVDEMKKQQSGSIVNISSVAGLQGVGFQFSYSVSKWAVRGMTKSAAHELARHNIRVNSVHPGLIETAMLDQFPDNLQPRVESVVPMGRSAEAAEVAELVLWLASQESSYCTGSEFGVDGGLSVA